MPELWRSISGLYRERGHENFPYVPLEHPLAQRVQRAIESLTAVLRTPDSGRQYRWQGAFFPDLSR